MSDSVYAQGTVFQFPGGRAVEREARRQTQYDALTSELQAARAREKAWLREKSDHLQRHDTLAQEFEHRLANSLQIIVSVLSLQSRTASPEAAAQLTVAASRVASFARVHRRLHVLDHQASVEFKQYLQQLCEDLFGLLLEGGTDCTITVEAAEIDIPTTFAIPLAFILNELITNSAKYAKSNITVRLETSPITGHSLSVSDDGPGLPEGFDPARSKGLGMKIIATLVKQIGGALQITPGDEGHGTRFTVKFSPPFPEDRAVVPKRRKSFDPKAFLAQVGDGRSIGKYRKGQVVFSQGDTGDAVFYIQEGKVKITVVSEQGKEAVVALLGTDDFFGEGCLAEQMQRISTVTAVTDSVIARLAKSAVVRAIREEPAFSEMFIAHLLGRTIRVEADLVGQLFNSSEKRLARTLLLLANFRKESKPEPIIATISQETLAEMIGTTRSRVSFFMNKFRELGFVSYNGGMESGIEVHSALLNVVLHDQPQIKSRPDFANTE